jgi:hypothetical protein
VAPVVVRAPRVLVQLQYGTSPRGLHQKLHATRRCSQRTVDLEPVKVPRRGHVLRHDSTATPRQTRSHVATETSARPRRGFLAAIAATRWPERETLTDSSQGVPLAPIPELAGYWATEYDWRKCEARLNAVPHFITEIDGLDIHFIHVRSQHDNALSLIVTHGWLAPSSSS